MKLGLILCFSTKAAMMRTGDYGELHIVHDQVNNWKETRKIWTILWDKPYLKSLSSRCCLCRFFVWTVRGLLEQEWHKLPKPVTIDCDSWQKRLSISNNVHQGAHSRKAQNTFQSANTKVHNYLCSSGLRQCNSMMTRHCEERKRPVTRSFWNICSSLFFGYLKLWRAATWRPTLFANKFVENRILVNTESWRFSVHKTKEKVTPLSFFFTRLQRRKLDNSLSPCHPHCDGTTWDQRRDTTTITSKPFHTRFTRMFPSHLPSSRKET